MGRTDPMTHVTRPDLLTSLTYDPWPTDNCQLCLGSLCNVILEPPQWALERRFGIVVTALVVLMKLLYRRARLVLR